MFSVTLPTERVSWNVVAFVPLARHYVTLPTERVSWNSFFIPQTIRDYRHAPHGACELKLVPVVMVLVRIVVTLPTERVSWNFDVYINIFKFTKSRSPRSVWVEICYVFVKKKLQLSHAPHGACELKFFGYGISRINE